eukprot:sb/3478445/
MTLFSVYMKRLRDSCRKLRRKHRNSSSTKSRITTTSSSSSGISTGYVCKRSRSAGFVMDNHLNNPVMLLQTPVMRGGGGVVSDVDSSPSPKSIRSLPPMR